MDSAIGHRVPWERRAPGQPSVADQQRFTFLRLAEPMGTSETDALTFIGISKSHPTPIYGQVFSGGSWLRQCAVRTSWTSTAGKRRSHGSAHLTDQAQRRLVAAVLLQSH